MLVWPLLKMNRNREQPTRPVGLATVPGGPATTALAYASLDESYDHLWRIQDVAGFLDVPVATTSAVYGMRVRLR